MHVISLEPNAAGWSSVIALTAGVSVCWQTPQLNGARRAAVVPAVL